jgi:hypothetical protein
VEVHHLRDPTAVSDPAVVAAAHHRPTEWDAVAAVIIVTAVADLHRLGIGIVEVVEETAVVGMESTIESVVARAVLPINGTAAVVAGVVGTKATRTVEQARTISLHNHR